METWLLLAALAALCIAGGSLCAKWSQTLGVSVLDYVTGYTLLQALLALALWAGFTQTRGGRRALARIVNASPAPRRLWGWPQLITGTLFAVLSLLAVAAVQRAPNPGYASSVVSASSVIVALVAPLLFPNIALSYPAFIGILLVAGGISLISLSSKSSSQ